MGFILTIFLGRALVKLLQFLADPKNIAIVEKIGDFFSSKFGFITAGIVAFGIAATGLMATIVGLTGRLLLSSVLGGGSGLGFLGNLRKLLPGFSKKVPITTSGGEIFSKRGPIDDIFKKLFRNLKFREDGGDLNKGDISIVGEGGPEIFVPQKSGTVIPNNQIGNFFRRRLNRGSLNQFGQSKISSGAAGRVRTPVFSGRPYQGPKIFGKGPGFATRNISTANTYTNPSLLKGLPGTGGVTNQAGSLDMGSLPNRYIQKFGSKSLLGQDQIKMSRSAYARTFGVKTMQQSTRSMLGLGKGLLKRLPLIDLLMDLAFPQPLADGTLTGAQQRNIPGTPVMRSNSTPPPPNLGEAFTQLSQGNDSETFINDTFSINLPSADENVLATYGIGR